MWIFFISTQAKFDKSRLEADKIDRCLWTLYHWRSFCIENSKWECSLNSKRDTIWSIKPTQWNTSPISFCTGDATWQGNHKLSIVKDNLIHNIQATRLQALWFWGTWLSNKHLKDEKSKLKMNSNKLFKSTHSELMYDTLYYSK